MRRAKHPLRPMSVVLLLVSLTSLVTAGCGKYSALRLRSPLPGRDLRCSGPPTRWSTLGKGSLAGPSPGRAFNGMPRLCRKPGRPLGESHAPPVARTRHERAVEAVAVRSWCNRRVNEGSGRTKRTGSPAGLRNSNRSCAKRQGTPQRNARDPHGRLGLWTFSGRSSSSSSPCGPWRRNPWRTS